jgi:hypothetical protein
VAAGPTPQKQPPPPVARPHTPAVFPPAPPPPPAPEVVEELELEELLVELPSGTHWPSRQTSPDGQRTPSQGQLPQVPSMGLQQELSVQGLGLHLPATQVGGVAVRSQT